MDSASQTTLFDMAYRALRTALYTALFIFSAILLGVSSSRVRHTNTTRGGRFYDSIVVELIVTSILALLWSLFLIFGICLALGGCLSFLTELIGLGILWVMFLVGAAIVTHRYHNLGYCRGFNVQCRLLSAILSWSWVCWAVTTFLILASLAAIVLGKHGIRSAVHGSGTRRHRGRDAAAVGAVAGAGAAAEHHHHHERDKHYNTTSGAAAANADVPNTTNNVTTGTAPQAGYNEKPYPTTGTTGYNNTTGATGYNSNAPDYDSRGYNAGGTGYDAGHNIGGDGNYGSNMAQRDVEGPITTGPVGAAGSARATGTGGDSAAQYV